MMLADYLDWKDEEIHLEILQNKINYYLQYITNKQYIKDYGEISKFIEVVSKQLYEENIFLEIHIDEEG